MTRQEFICICKVFISIKPFQKTFKNLLLQLKKTSPEALRFTLGATNLDQTGLKFTTLFWSGKSQKSIPCSGTKNVNHISCSGVTTLSLKKFCFVLYCVGDKDHIYALLI